MRHKKTMPPEAAERLKDMGKRGRDLCDEAMTLIDSWDVMDNIYSTEYAQVRSLIRAGLAGFSRMETSERGRGAKKGAPA
jgi:hypothetical protein